jgi:hypothetical protein
MLKIFTYKIYRFKIVEHHQKNGSILYTPMAKEPSLFSPWRQIIQIYDKFELMEYPHIYTKEECYEHINGFKNQLTDKENNKIVKTIETEIS